MWKRETRRVGGEDNGKGYEANKNGQEHGRMILTYLSFENSENWD